MLRILFSLIAISSLLMACSSENADDYGTTVPPTADSTSLVQLTVVFSLPHTVTPAQKMNQFSTMVGTGAENKVSTATIIMGEMIPGTNAPFYLDYKYEIKQLTQVNNSATLWKGNIKVKPGYYRIIAIANPPSYLSTEINRLFGVIKQPWDKLSDLAVRVRSFGQLQDLYKDDYFLMTNAHTANRLEFDYNIQRGTNTIATINVQRACARVDYTPEKNNRHSLTLNSDELNKEVNLNIEFTEVAPVNINRNFYLFKTISSDDKGIDKTFYAAENETNYVVDSDWERKRNLYKMNIDDSLNTSSLRALFFSNTEIKNRLADEVIKYQPLPNQPGKLFYLTENTLPGIEPQVNKLSTGVLFKAKFTFDDPTLQNSEVVYYYQTKGGIKKIYQDLQNLKHDLITDKMITDPASWQGTDEEVARCKARKFKKADDGNFYVWYSYWNRHRNNFNNNVMGNLEFAVVRNNIYDLSIRSVSSLGYPDEPVGNSIWKPVGETPDELPLMLDVKVKVSDWVERVVDYEI